ncbi:MAG: NAD(P)-dependent oxidoreductase [Pseudomonadota bacterium]
MPSFRPKREEATMRIGIAGVGRMGAAIAERLLGLGHEVHVWNRTPARVEPLVAKGAVAATSLRDLAGAVEAVISIVTDAAAIEAVYGDLLDGSIAGKLVIEMSTVRPEVERHLASRVKAAGADFVECPVGGTVAPARDGKLLGFAAGEAGAIERARPILDALCRRWEPVGEVGNGARVKLAINLPLAVYWQALGESLALCREVGLSGETLVSLLADSSAGPNVLKNRAALVAKAIDGERVPGTFDVDGMRKDLRTMIEEAQAKGTTLPVAEATLAAYDQGAAAGLGNLDGATQSYFWSRKGS